MKEKFDIDNVLAIIGEGIGGCEVFTWAAEYPDYMEHIVSLNNMSKLSGRNYVFFKSIEAILESNEALYSDVYDSSLSQLVVVINRLLFLNYLSRDQLANASREEVDAMLEDFVEAGLFRDIFDLKYLTKCLLEYDVVDKLSNIKASTLIVTTSDLFYMDIENDVLPLEGTIDNVVIKVITPEAEEFDYNNKNDSIYKILSFVNEYEIE